MHRWAGRLPAAVLIIMAPALLAAGVVAAEPSATDRTMPHLKFVCPAALGDHKFAGILPDGPRQEQCFFDDGQGSSFAVGAWWAPEPADPGDTRAVCADPVRTSWFEEGSGTERLGRSSATLRAGAYIFLDLYWPNSEKLARQRALLGQAEALGNQMLAAAERLAQPCYPAKATVDPSPSDSASPDVSSSVEPTSSPTASAGQGPMCRALSGQVSDTAGRSVEGVVVRLDITGQEPLEVATDAQGRFLFDQLPDTADARAVDAGQLQLLVRDGNGMWRIHAGDKEATLVTTRFPLTESAGCTHDVATRSLDGYESANPTTTARWADLWAIVTRTRRALDYVQTTLGVGLRDVPVVVYAWCPVSLEARTCIPHGDGAFAIDRPPTDADASDGLGGTGRVPYLAIASGLSDQMSEAPEDDTVYHELGHIVQADLAGGFSRLLVADRTAHNGYANASSNDSWVEGFASWFAISVRQADARPSAYYEWANHARKSIEPDIKAWDANGKDEEWALAGLLTDLTDGGPNGLEQGQPVPLTVTGSGWARLIDGTATGARPGKDVVVIDLLDAAGRRVGSDQAQLFPDGRFLDVPTVEFARARALRRPAGAGVGGGDDDPFTMSPRAVIGLITDPPNIGTRGGRTDRSSMIFDLDELHAVLRSRLARPKEVDALFIAHGFHENLQNRNRYIEGAAVGMTTHPPFDADLDPRHQAQILPAQFVEVDTRGAQATVVVFPQNGVPYSATPDAHHRVPVMIPGSLDSRAAVVTLVKGSVPAVTVIEGRTFWPQAAQHDGPFLVIQPKLQPLNAAHSKDSRTSLPGELLLGTGLAIAVLALGVGAALLGRARRRGKAV